MSSQETLSEETETIMFLAPEDGNNSVCCVYAKQYVKHIVLSCQYMLDNVLLNHFIVRLNPSLESSY